MGLFRFFMTIIRCFLKSVTQRSIQLVLGDDVDPYCGMFDKAFVEIVLYDFRGGTVI